MKSAIQHIRNDLYYPTFVEKLTRLFFSANRSHCFQDGNKRIAISLRNIFLLKNSYLEAAQWFLHKMKIISYHLVAGRIEKEFPQNIIQPWVYEKDYSEEIKLKLLNCITKEDNNEW